MSEAGQRVANILMAMADGDLERVKIAEQYWCRETPLHRAAPELLKALREAIEIVKIFHGPSAWDIYESKAPEMQRWKAAIAKAEDW